MKHEEKPTWYWKEKYQEQKDRHEAWRFVAIMAMLFMFMFAAKCCQLMT